MMAPDASWHVDDVPLGLLMASDDGRILQANALFGQMLGLGPDEWVGQRLDQVFMPAARLLYHSYLLPLLKLHGHVAEVSLPLRARDGRRVDTLFTASREVPEDASGAGVVRFAFLPWRERRRLEDQLLSAKRAAEQVPGLLFELRQDAQGGQTFPYASEALREMFGVPPQAAMHSAEAVWAAVHPDDVARVRQEVADSARTLQPWRGEYRVIVRGQQGWRETHASPQRQPDGGCLWHGYTSDVSERKALEAQVMERDAAERASRAKSDFLARVSHELRTPLNGILGFSQLLLTPGRGIADPGHQRQVRYIDSAGRALLQLVDEVLDIARIESGGVRLRMDQVDLMTLLSEAAQLVLPLAQARGVTFALTCSHAGAVRVMADPQRLVQCLLNLLSNAVKYGPAGGVVSVDVAVQPDRVAVSVGDQGPGLTPAQRAHLFEPFNRLGAEHTDVEGSGLGLVITKGLVELMGGQLHADNAPQGGACFVLTLRPAATEAISNDVSGRQEAASPQAVDPGPVEHVIESPVRHQVLYVEDNEINAILMESVFQMMPPCTLRIARTAQEALDLARQCPPDLLLLDMHLPDDDGLALLARLRRLPGLADTPAVAVSADAIADNIAKALRSGCLAYWTKPLDLEKVVPELKLLLSTLADRSPEGLALTSGRA